MQLNYSAYDIVRCIAQPFIDRGTAYLRQHRVGAFRVEGRGGLITGQVQGELIEPYQVVVQLLPEPNGQTRIVGRCTCPIGLNCKHVAALLLHGLVQAKLLPQGTVSDAALDNWLNELTIAQAKEDPPPAAPAESLLYLLQEAQTGTPNGIDVRLVTARTLKNRSGYGKETPYTSFSIGHGFLTKKDVQILFDLRQRNGISWLTRLDRQQPATLLQAMIETGRCFWATQDSAPLTWGEPRDASLTWQLDESGAQHIKPVARDISRVIPLSPPCYLDMKHNQCGQLDFHLPERVALTLLAAPPIAPEQVKRVHKKLLPLAHNSPTLLPDRDIERQTVRGKPVVRLHLTQIQIPNYDSPFYGQPQTRTLTCGRLSFDYDGEIVFRGEPQTTRSKRVGNLVTRWTRDEAAEKDAARRLEDGGLRPFFAPDADGGLADVFTPIAHTPTEWLDFVRQHVPALKESGWRIIFDDNFPFQVLDETEPWHARLEEGDGGWFDLELGITVDDRQINLLPILVAALRTYGKDTLTALADEKKTGDLLLRIDGNHVLPVPFARLRPLLGTLVELFDPKINIKNAGRLNGSQAVQLAHLEQQYGDGLRWTGGERLRERGRKLLAFEKVSDVAPPSGLQAKLRPYQRQGLNWLQFLREYDLGGILADDMGLGKTIQTLAHVLVEKESGRADRPSLVIAPTSLVHNWRQEAQRFAPALRVLALHGADRQRYFGRLTDYDLVITTYPLLRRDHDLLMQTKYHLLILDEAQYIKNARAMSSTLVRKLHARHRLCLSGTPMENHLGELWSLVDFLMPGLLGDDQQFRRLFRTPIEKHNDTQRQQSLKRRVAPFLLRRTKLEVAKELPPKTEIVSSCELTGAQRDLYETIRLSMHKKLREAVRQKGLSRSYIVLLEALLRLRQVCCDPRLIKSGRGQEVKHSAKLDALMDMLPAMIDEGRRILLFSQFTEMLALIEEELNKRSISFVKLTGQTKDRVTPIERFQSGDVPLFLISLKAGGIGLNLTRADTVIHYDPWWNPAVENQATDRAHRIGQNKAVFVYKLITAGTVEEKILALQSKKKLLADGVLDAESAADVNLTGEDIEALFEPLS